MPLETPAPPALASNSRRDDSYLLAVIFAALALFPIARLLAFVFSADGSNAAEVQATLHNPVLLRMLGASALVALISTAICAFVGYGMSRADQRRGRRRNTWDLTLLFGGAMILLPLYLGAARLGLISRQAASAVVYALIALPFCIARLKIAAATITPAMLDVARVDGCSTLACFRLIVLPSLARALVISAVFCLAIEWNLRALYALLFADRPAGQYAAALALLLSIPLLILFLLLSTRSAVGEKPVND